VTADHTPAVANGHTWPCPGFYTGNRDALLYGVKVCTCRPPVTVDHTPERLSAEERAHRADAERMLYDGTLRSASVALTTVRGLLATIDRLAAHLADVEARLAAVEAVLAEPDDVQQWEDDTHECPDFLEVPIVTVARVRAALHPDPSKPAGAKP
jgi:hypothetical protein